MSSANLDLEILKTIVRELAPVKDELVFIGGATISLYIDEPQHVDIRETYDVDCVVEVIHRTAYEALSQKLRSIGFSEDMNGQVTCRFKKGEMILDPAPFFSVVCKPSESIKKLGTGKKEIYAEKVARKHRKAQADTIIVPARKEGFDRVFIRDNCWWSIRIKESKIPDLKYIAAYQVSPISAITHVAKVKEIIESEQDPGKYKVIFDGPAREIKPIPMGKISKIQGPAYCEYSKIADSRNIDELLTNTAIASKKAA